MALDPNTFQTDGIATPLSTGFEYRDREDMSEGFELRPEVIEAMAVRREHFGDYHVSPADAHAIVAKGAGTSVLQQETIAR
jgi:hypothetical protein